MEQVAKFKRAWNFAPVLQIVRKFPEKYSPCLYLWIDHVWLVNELWFKRYHSKMHRLIYYYLSWHHRFVKSWDSWKYKSLDISRMEHNFSMKKINLCLRWHILRSYCFVVEITFKRDFICELLDTDMILFHWLANLYCFVPLIEVCQLCFVLPLVLILYNGK